jgi:hypothetical protein
VSLQRHPHPSAPCVSPLRFTTPALGLDRQSHARFAARAPPCHLAHNANCHGDSSTRPSISASLCWAAARPPQPPILGALPIQQPASSLCLITCFAMLKKHLGKGVSLCQRTPPRLIARHAPVPRRLRETGIAASGKLGLEIISGIKGAQPCHPTISAGDVCVSPCGMHTPQPRTSSPLLRLLLCGL